LFPVRHVGELGEAAVGFELAAAAARDTFTGGARSEQRKREGDRGRDRGFVQLSLRRGKAMRLQVGNQMPRTTWIRDASWIVAWDEANGRQSYLTNADLVFSDDAIAFVGRRFRGAADETIDGRGLLVMPGLIDIHSHPSTEPFYRGIHEEHGVPQMYMSGLYARSPSRPTRKSAASARRSPIARCC
jgi:hypothetical protein